MTNDKKITKEKFQNCITELINDEPLKESIRKIYGHVTDEAVTEIMIQVNLNQTRIILLEKVVSQLLEE